MPQTALASGLGEEPEASCSIEFASPADTAWNEVSTRQRAEAAPGRGAVGCAGEGRAAAVAAQAGDGHSQEHVVGAAVTSAETGAGNGWPPVGSVLARPGSRCSDLHWSSEAAFAIRLASPRSQRQPSRAITAAAETEGQPMGQQEGLGQGKRQTAQVSHRAAGPRELCGHLCCRDLLMRVLEPVYLAHGNQTQHLPGNCCLPLCAGSSAAACRGEAGRARGEGGRAAAPQAACR